LKPIGKGDNIMSRPLLKTDVVIGFVKCINNATPWGDLMSITQNKIYRVVEDKGNYWCVIGNDGLVWEWRKSFFVIADREG
jgi:hypothetical protein